MTPIALAIVAITAVVAVLVGRRLSDRSREYPVAQPRRRSDFQTIMRDTGDEVDRTVFPRRRRRPDRPA